MNIFQIRECETDQLLGFKIIRIRLERMVWIIQDIYIANMAAKYELDQINKTSTPLPITYGKTNNSETIEFVKYQAPPQTIHEYQSKVGSIRHAAMFTRPDVAKYYSLLAGSLSNSTQNGLTCADRCF